MRLYNHCLVSGDKREDGVDRGSVELESMLIFFKVGNHQIEKKTTTVYA